MNDEGHISLPALQSDLSQQPQVQIHGGRSAARRAMAAGREGLNIVNRYRILIVDDDAMAREILKRILEHAGYEVMTAGSGPEALRKLHEGIPHLVVVDLMMPEMDGFELCRRIKSHLDVPIVILVRNAGRVVTNETLLAKAWAGDEEAYEEGLRVHISRLRSKIESNPSKPTYIQTKRGVGYRFSATVNFLLELPDKTALAALLLATRHRPLPVFLGAAAAFVIQSAVAVAAGSLLSLLPREPIRIGAGILFLRMAALLVAATSA